MSRLRKLGIFMIGASLVFGIYCTVLGISSNDKSLLLNALTGYISALVFYINTKYMD